MATTGQAIITAAINRSLANDGGTTPLANDPLELLGFLNRLVRQLYGMAALPASEGAGADRTASTFTRQVTVTMASPATDWAALPSTPEIARIFFASYGGAPVVLQSLRDLRWDQLEWGPVCLVADGKIRSAGRSGDPTAGSSVVLDVAYLPAEMTATGHYIGATSPADDTTTNWPSWAGDPWLTDSLALYLAVKDGTRDGAEMQELKAGIDQAAALLAPLFGLTPTQLATVQES